MNGYVLFFMLYLLAGICVCALVFCWAVKNGQFMDQQRARYLPLVGEDLSEEGLGTVGKSHAMTVSILLILGFLGVQIVAVLYMVI